MIPVMTPPVLAKKVLLIPAGSSEAGHGHGPVRRYRVARLRFDAPPESPDRRFDYLKRTYD